MAQNEKIERLFLKFDTDGSGALDSGELFELFRENGVEIDAETVKDMFNNQAFTLRNFKDINNSPSSLLRFRSIMRAIRNLVKERNNRTFVPYSFESMMQLFGQNMDREALSSKMEDFIKQLDKLVKNTSAPKTDIEKAVQESLGNFMKMIMKNDVDEADLSNQDNKLYQKLIDRSKSLPPGLKLDSPEAMYKFEQIATE